MPSEIEKVVFYCFSGTGNTLMVVRRMANVFEAAGLSVSINLIPCDWRPPEQGTLCVFAFPVYEQTIPAFAYDWMFSISPLKSEVPACVLTTLAGKSGFVKTPLRVLLIERNFKPLGVREIRMPSNYLLPQSKRNAAAVFARGLMDAAKFAESILDGKAQWPPASRFLSLQFPLVRLAGRVFTKVFSKFHASDACDECGLCVKLCPVDNIAIGKSGCVWDGKCQLCLRCVNFCPNDAVRNRLGGFLIHRYRAEGVRAGDFLNQES